jgi:hypothetical protein
MPQVAKWKVRPSPSRKRDSSGRPTPGLVLTWEHTSTRLDSIYSHTAITAGDGHSSCSDFIETNTLAGSSGRSGLRIFMPWLAAVGNDAPPVARRPASLIVSACSFGA